MNGAGGAAGTVLGGVITQELSWRWVLLINPPIGIAAAVIAYRVVTERRRDDRKPQFDLAGALTLTLGQLVLIYGIVTARATAGRLPTPSCPWWPVPVCWPCFASSKGGLAAPLVPFKEVTKPLQVANVIVLLFSAALFPMWYVSSLYLQQVLGLSPLVTGFAFLPMALAIFLVASRAGGLVGKFGVRAVLGSGLVIMSSGMLLLARIGPSGSAVTYVVLPGVLTAHWDRALDRTRRPYLPPRERDRLKPG